MPTFLPMKKH